MDSVSDRDMLLETPPNVGGGLTDLFRAWKSARRLNRLPLAAQRDVLDLTLIEAALRSGDRPLSIALVNARLARERDARRAAQAEVTALNADLERRVAGNLNVSFNFVEGESLIMALKDMAVSSGSACTSASLEPSYVLRALGREDELAHSSIRFTIGRFTTREEIDYVVGKVRHQVERLRELSPLWEMYKEGIDLNSVQWAAH